MFLQKEKTKFMFLAFEQARKAFQKQEVPVGCVIVSPEGVVLAKGYNLKEGKQDTTRHAEIMAIQKASKKLGTWRLDHCILFTTLEPCIMCAGAIQHARIKSVYFSVRDPKFGGVGSLVNVFELPTNHKVNYQAGIYEQEVQILMRSFFSDLRKKNKARKKREETAE